MPSTLLSLSLDSYVGIIKYNIWATVNMSLKAVPGKDQPGDQACTENGLSVVIKWRKTASQAQHYVYEFSNCREINPLLGSDSKVRLESMNL